LAEWRHVGTIVPTSPSVQRTESPPQHVYADERGNVVFINAKYGDGIGWRPWSKNGDGWVCNASKRIAYRLRDLIASTSDTVILTEGERDADTIASLGWVATSFKSWKREWNRYLAKFSRVIAIGDDDSAGDQQINGFDPGKPVLRFSTGEFAHTLGITGKDVTELLAAIDTERLRNAIDGLLDAESPPVDGHAIINAASVVTRPICWLWKISHTGAGNHLGGGKGRELQRTRRRHRRSLRNTRPIVARWRGGM
jgi:hypothetical protein